MIRGYTVALDVHVENKKPKKVKVKKGEKPPEPPPKVREFHAHWVGTFMEFPERDCLCRAISQDAVNYLNSDDKREEGIGQQKLGIVQVLKQMPNWPTSPGDYSNDFITIKIRDLPLYGTPPVPTVPKAVQQVAAQMDSERAAAGMGSPVPNGKSLVSDGEEVVGQDVQSVRPDPAATA